MKNFEWLLKDLGWTTYDQPLIDRTIKYCSHPEKGHSPVGQLKTYGFIAAIPIEDWHKYWREVRNVIYDKWNKGGKEYASSEERDEATHNAPLDARILAHCKARGMK